MSTVEDRVKKITVELLNENNHAELTLETVTLDKAFVDDLRADELDQAELIMALEKEFGIVIPEEDAHELRTVGDAVAYVEKRVV